MAPTPSANRHYGAAVDAACLALVARIAEDVPTIVRTPAAQALATSAAKPHDRPAGILESAVLQATRCVSDSLRPETLRKIWLGNASPEAVRAAERTRERARLDAPATDDSAVALAALTAHSGSPRLAAVALDAVADATEADPRLVPGDGAEGFAARRRRAAVLLRDLARGGIPVLTVADAEEAERVLVALAHEARDGGAGEPDARQPAAVYDDMDDAALRRAWLDAGREMRRAGRDLNDMPPGHPGRAATGEHLREARETRGEIGAAAERRGVELQPRRGVAAERDRRGGEGR